MALSSIYTHKFYEGIMAPCSVCRTLSKNRGGVGLLNVIMKEKYEEIIGRRRRRKVHK